MKNYKLTIDVLFAIVISCFIFKLIVKVLNSKFDFDFSGIVAEISKNVSIREYYRFKFQIRDFEISTTIYLLARRLFQQFIVDVYIKIETSRLDFHRIKQSKIRSELYQGIVDSVIVGKAKGSQIGKKLFSFNFHWWS